MDPINAPLASVLLLLAPNLQRFHLPLHRLGSFATTHQTLKPSIPSSTSLKTLAFSSFERECLFDETAPTIRQTPNLEILHCHGLARVTELFPASLGRKTPDDRAPLHHLTELALIDTFLTTQSFCNLLRVVGPKLTKVNIRRTSSRWFLPPDSDHEIGIVEFDGALTALQPWRHTLKELSFTMYGPQKPYLPPHKRCNVPQLLREFDALEILWAQAAFFDFYDRLGGPPDDALKATLPSSIRELRLFGHCQFSAGLRGLIGALRFGQFAHLRWVEIDDQGFGNCAPDSEPARELMHITASFRAAGVALVVGPPPGESGGGDGRYLREAMEG
jgi:hypothetical protein